MCVCLCLCCVSDRHSIAIADFGPVFQSLSDRPERPLNLHYSRSRNQSFCDHGRDRSFHYAIRSGAQKNKRTCVHIHVFLIWETDVYTPPVHGGAALFAIQRQRCFKNPEFYTPLALNCKKGNTSQLSTGGVYKSISHNCQGGRPT